MNITDPSLLAQLTRLSEKVNSVLLKALSLGSVYIVTNAMKGWVEFSAQTWLKDSLPILQNIPIISAREEYIREYPYDFQQWKIQTFLELAGLFDTGTVTNIVCLGDSDVELNAGRILSRQYHNAVIKTIKFNTLPDVQSIITQLKMLIVRFEKIVYMAKDVNIRLSKK